MSTPGTLAALYASHLAQVKRNHDSALQESGFELVAIFSGAQHVAFLDDYGYPFKVNPHFKYWLPLLQNPHCFIVYAPGEKPIIAYYQPVDYWHQPPSDPHGYWVDQFDVRVISSPEQAAALIPPGRRTAFIGEWSDAFASWSFAEHNPQGLIDRLHWTRAWKSDYEIVCLDEANRISVRGHLAAERVFRSGGSEHEIHLAYLAATLHIEEELPYGNIVTLNEHASVLHYQTHLVGRQRTADPRSFLIDAGAQYNGYASDVTRTYSRRDDEFQEMITAMDSMQRALCESIRPGIDYRDVHLEAHRGVGAILNRFGIVKLAGDDAFNEQLTSFFFPHGVGHYLGLQVHDVAGFMGDRCGATIDKPEGHPYLRLVRSVEEGQVFTIEPGLYFIQSLLSELRSSDESRHIDWERVEAFRPFGGIRIEDDLVVTAEGHRNLTRDAFRELDVAGEPAGRPAHAMS